MAGQTIYVSADAGENGDGSQDAPYASIQAAIDAMAPGDTISVGAGVYEENVKIKDGGTADAPVRIVSADGPGAAVIRPADTAKDTINIAGADNVEISGFEIYGTDDAKRPAIHIHATNDNTNPATNITVTDTVIHCGKGDGIKISKSNDVTLEGNTIEGGGREESGIDMVGANGVRIADNTITDTPGIGIMIKGGSQDIDLVDNILDNIGRNAVEVGGYTPSRFYPPGFLEDGNAFEAMNVLLSGNQISDVDNTAIRIIGAIQVIIEGNSVTDANHTVKVDDSSKFHETWYADDLTFIGNLFEESDWLNDRSDRADIQELEAPGDSFLCVMPDLATEDTAKTAFQDADTFVFVPPGDAPVQEPDPQADIASSVPGNVQTATGSDHGLRSGRDSYPVAEITMSIESGHDFMAF